MLVAFSSPHAPVPVRCRSWLSKHSQALDSTSEPAPRNGQPPPPAPRVAHACVMGYEKSMRAVLTSRAVGSFALTHLQVWVALILNCIKASLGIAFWELCPFSTAMRSLIGAVSQHFQVLCLHGAHSALLFLCLVLGQLPGEPTRLGQRCPKAHLL